MKVRQKGQVSGFLAIQRLLGGTEDLVEMVPKSTGDRPVRPYYWSSDTVPRHQYRYSTLLE